MVLNHHFKALYETPLMTLIYALIDHGKPGKGNFVYSEVFLRSQKLDTGDARSKIKLH